MKAKLQEDIKTAMKERDTMRLNTLRGFMSEIKREEIDTRADADDAKCLAIAQKEIKKRRDALDFARQANREDLIAQNEAELKILQGYLPEQYSEEKLKELISNLIASGADNVGKIMGALNKDHKGKFEGKIASDIAKNLIAAK